AWVREKGNKLDRAAVATPGRVASTPRTPGTRDSDGISRQLVGRITIHGGGGGSSAASASGRTWRSGSVASEDG
ncbi:unnamed protein product, partial [Ectocarpus fasciculatus]